MCSPRALSDQARWHVWKLRQDLDRWLSVEDISVQILRARSETARGPSSTFGNHGRLRELCCAQRARPEGQGDLTSTGLDSGERRLPYSSRACAWWTSDLDMVLLMSMSSRMAVCGEPALTAERSAARTLVVAPVMLYPSI